MLTDTIAHHDHESGYYHPSMGRVLFHTEKRGPAFQAANATTRLLMAMNRGVFLDVIPAWTDLLAAVNMKPSALAIADAYWPQMVDAVKAALLSGTGEDSLCLWASADEHVRGYARMNAATWDKDAQQTQGGDDWADVDQARQDEIQHANTQSARLRAFAEGAAR